MNHWRAAYPEYREIYDRAHRERTQHLEDLARGTAAAIRRALRAFAQAAHWLPRRLHEHRLRARAMRELSMLSDRDLKDIGLHRSELPSLSAEFARNAVRRRRSAGRAERRRSKAAAEDAVPCCA